MLRKQRFSVIQLVRRADGHVDVAFRDERGREVLSFTSSDKMNEPGESLELSGFRAEFDVKTSIEARGCPF